MAESNNAGQIAKILGVRFGHDSSACLLVNGELIADVAEERFTRIKNDGSFPISAIKFCLQRGKLDSEEIDAIAVPAVGALSPTFFSFFAIPEGERVNLDEGGGLKQRVRNLFLPQEHEEPTLPLYLEKFKLSKNCKFFRVQHHLAHASCAYYTSGLHDQKVLVMTMDGIGDGDSVCVWSGHRNNLELIQRWDGTGSLGWFYSAATEALGWRHGCDEWKTMGLAPYGRRQPGLFNRFHPVYREGQLVLPHDFGDPKRWNDHGANHYHLRDSIPLRAILEGTKKEDFAAETQGVVEDQALGLIRFWLRRLDVRSLCCAGGFFLNVKLNQRVWYSGDVENHWVFPNPGDSGLAMGAALYVYVKNHPNVSLPRLESLYLGPDYSKQEIRALLDERKLAYKECEDLGSEIARHLVKNHIVAILQGRMESGPRALGNRSILMSPLHAANKDIINSCVKYREAFRPFCPSILEEDMSKYLVSARPERFMISSFDVAADKASRIPAVVHVDKTVRPQTVRKEDNQRYHDIIRSFGELTGETAVLNTSFNVKGEPIVCSPRDAIRCFHDTGLDVLVLEDCVITKPSLA